jgi:hypothetical protein
MAQQADNAGRNASLDEKKGRSAGRQARTGQAAPGREQIRDAAVPLPMKGKTGGASGREGHPNRRGGGVVSQGAGGGGGGPTPAADSYLSTGRSKRPARKRK